MCTCIPTKLNRFSYTLSPFKPLLGLVVRASTLRVEDVGFDSHLDHGDFSGPSHNSDLTIDTPVVTLPGAWHYRVSAGTGRPSVGIL